MIRNTTAQYSEKNASEKKVLIARFAGRGKQPYNLKWSKCTYLVSIGKENFEDNAVEAVCRLINDEFRECEVLVADTLQRYNLAVMNGTSPNEEKENARKKGDEWIKKCTPLFQKIFNIKYFITRWDDVIQDQKFANIRKEIKQTCLTDENYNNALINSKNEYCERQQEHMGNEAYEKVKKSSNLYCKRYLQEESSWLSLAGKDENCSNYIVYPGKTTEILSLTHKMFVESNDINKLEWLVVRFKKVKEKQLSKNIDLGAPLKISLCHSHYFLAGKSSQKNSEANNQEIEKLTDSYFVQITTMCKFLPFEQQEIFVVSLMNKLYSVFKQNEGVNELTNSTRTFNQNGRI